MKNTTTVLVAAGAVLAAVIVTRTPAQQATGVGVCCYPGGYCQPVEGDLQACLDSGAIYIPTGVSCDDCPPPPGPTVVGVSTDHVSSTSTSFVIRVTRVWSDGQIDTTAYTGNDQASVCDVSLNPCPVIVLVPGTCPTIQPGLRRSRPSSAGQ